MSFKITDHTPTLIIKGEMNASIFLRIACDVLTDLSGPRTPKSSGQTRSGAKTGSGNLRNDTLKQVLGLKASVKWRKSYAQYQERGQRADGSHKVRRYTTAGTGPHFAENAANMLPGRTQEIARRSGLI